MKVNLKSSARNMSTGTEETCEEYRNVVGLVGIRTMYCLNGSQ
jgi:hypothetical protein